MEEIDLSNVDDKDKGKNRKIILYVVLACVGFVVAFVVTYFTIDTLSKTMETPINYENYLKIKSGMTYEEVVSIFDGQNGDLESSSTLLGDTYSYYTWSDNYGTGVVTILFINNIVDTKSQFGLA